MGTSPSDGGQVLGGGLTCSFYHILSCANLRLARDKILIHESTVKTRGRIKEPTFVQLSLAGFFFNEYR